MIRHLTSESNYESIIKDGFIKPERNQIESVEQYLLEKLNGNNVLVDI